MRRFSLFLSFFIFLFFSQAALSAEINDSAVKTYWSYIGNTGPERWGKLTPNFALCAKGKLQSPINIPTKVLTAKKQLKFTYQAAPMVLLKDGLTKLTLGEHKLTINDGHSIQLNFPLSAKQYLYFNQQPYRLVQLHIHTPSENQWHGLSYPAEIHFVHQGKNGSLLILGVFVKHGVSHDVIEKIIQHLPKAQSQPLVVRGERINPKDLLPAIQNVYSFTGSLTTPPCLEGVQWLLMSEPITATSAQIVQLKKAVGGVNARSVHSLHDRIIYFME